MRFLFILKYKLEKISNNFICWFSLKFNVRVFSVMMWFNLKIVFGVIELVCKIVIDFF